MPTAQAADRLLADLEREIGVAYRTDCPRYGDRDVPVKYFLWVKVIDCAAVRQAVRPVSRLPAGRRHPPSRECAGLLRPAAI